MASKTYRTRGIVLRKTPLAESDLIIELLDERGCKLKLVAKGARKPQGRFSAHLELFNTCELLCVKGKNLDIATESRLHQSRKSLMADPVKNAAACVIAELLCAITQLSLDQPKLFEMTEVALCSLDECDDGSVSLILAADILKAMVFVGLRPMLCDCAICGGSEISHDEISSDLSGMRASDRDIRFSHIEGGIVCSACAKQAECAWVPRSAVVLACVLLESRFSQIEKLSVEEDTIFELLQLVQIWVAVHVEMKLKALGFYLDMRYLRS